MDQALQYTIYIGCRDSQTMQYVMSENVISHIVTDFFQKQEIAFSLLWMKGGYLYQSKSYAIEHTLVIDIIGNQNFDIIELSKALSMFMNQDCIMITRKTVEIGYR